MGNYDIIKESWNIQIRAYRTGNHAGPGNAGVWLHPAGSDPSRHAISNHHTTGIGIAHPASVSCGQAGGTLEIKKDISGRSLRHVYF